MLCTILFLSVTAVRCASHTTLLTDQWTICTTDCRTTYLLGSTRVPAHARQTRPACPQQCNCRQCCHYHRCRHCNHYRYTRSHGSPSTATLHNRCHYSGNYCHHCRTQKRRPTTLHLRPTSNPAAVCRRVPATRDISKPEGQQHSHVNNYRSGTKHSRNCSSSVERTIQSACGELGRNS